MRKVEVVGGVGLHTVPELLLIVQLIGYFEFHRCPSAPSTDAHGGNKHTALDLRVVERDSVDGLRMIWSVYFRYVYSMLIKYPHANQRIVVRFKSCVMEWV